MLGHDWRSAEVYAAVEALPPDALAWEFLRRNPDYRADYKQFLQESAAGAEAVAESARFARWGLTFRRGSRTPRLHPERVLAA